MLQKQNWMMVAMCTLALFVGVMVLHPFVAHHHDDSPLDSNSLLAIHTGVAERGFSAALLPIFFFEILALIIIAVRLSRALAQRGVQDIDIPTRLALQGALRSGILNTKSY